MRYVTAEEMRRIDRDAIEKRGIPASVLMENAGRSVAEEGMRLATGKRIVVFSGYGNNGGDGFVASRHFIKSGYDVKAFLVGKSRDFSSETKSNYEKLVVLGCVPQTITDEKNITDKFKQIEKPGLIIDAIFGIGIKGELSAFYVTLINRINLLASPIISIDIPSGLDSDKGTPLPIAVKAALTVTLGLPKVGFKNKEAKAYLGKVVVKDIGLELK